MLSKLELLMYREFLRIPTGMIASYSNPMDRLFNLVFIPGVSWIIFLIYATKPFPKGLRYLMMIAFTAFGIINGFYAPWVTFSQAWFMIVFLIPVFYYILETFIHRSAIYAGAEHYKILTGKAKDRFKDRKIRSLDYEIAHLKSKKSSKERERERLEDIVTQLETSHMAFGRNAAAVRNRVEHYRKQIEKLEKEINKLDAEINELERRKTRLGG